jgi:SagB-type dehydrogenase family enzyme
MSRILGTYLSHSDVNIAELFNENTKLYPDIPTDFNPKEEYSHAEMRAMTSGGRQYRGSLRLRCDPIEPNAASLSETIYNRRTIREITDQPLSLDRLGRVLIDTNGVTGKEENAGISLMLRSSPSGGALYPTEIYVFCNNVVNAPSGLYHFNSLTMELVLIAPEQSGEELAHICCDQSLAKTVPAVIIFTSVIQRSLRKYGARGYRYALLEIGHAAQNMLLSCSAYGLACMTTGGFYDDQLNMFLGVDGNDETAMYVAFIGYPVEDSG